MYLMLVTDDAELISRVSGPARQVGLGITALSEPAQITNAIDEELPCTLLVDLARHPGERLRTAELIQQDHPAAQIPVVILRPAPFKIPAGLQIRLQLERDDLPDDLGDQLIGMIRAHLGQRTEGRAHPFALDTLARIWRRELCGQLHISGHGRIITFNDGGLVNPNQLPALESALRYGGLRFTPRGELGLGDWYTVGQLLWQSARTLTTTGFYQKRQLMLFKPSEHAGRADLLPLSDATQTLLGDQQPNLPLARRLARLNLRPALLEQDLEVLWLLGLYIFHPTTLNTGAGPRVGPLGPNGPVTHTRSRTRGSDTRLGHSQMVDPRLKARLERRRLRREVETLSDADEWTVLGMRPTLNLDKIRRAGQRMLERYILFSETHTDPQVRALAEQIKERVQIALDNLEALHQVYEVYGPPHEPITREEIAFREGFLAMRRQDTVTAQRLFLAAHDAHAHSPRNLAYLGWATYLQQGTHRLPQVLEYLRLAESLNPKAPSTQYFLASIEEATGRRDQALRRLTNVIRRGQASDEILSLYRSLRQPLAPQR
ncbi:MAG: hypothetical protein AAFV53_05160 [Myxococcota bacterium]